jgi:hypothetical protein
MRQRNTKCGIMHVNAKFHFILGSTVLAKKIKKKNTSFHTATASTGGQRCAPCTHKVRMLSVYHARIKFVCLHNLITGQLFIKCIIFVQTLPFILKLFLLLLLLFIERKVVLF